MPVFLWERAWPAGLQVAVPAGKCLLPCPGPNRSRKTGRRLPGIRAAILAVCCPEGALPPQTACAVGEPAVAQVPGSMRGHPGTAVSGCWRYPAACPSRRHPVEMSPGSAQVRSYGNRAFVGAAAARHDMLRCARGGAAAEHAVQRGGGGTSRWTGLPSPGPGRCRVGAPWGRRQAFPWR